MLKLCILGMSIALVGGVGVVSMSATHEQNENVVNINRENKKLVSYNDEIQSITFSINELNTYTWINLANYINTNSIELSENDIGVTSVYLNNVQITFDDLVNDEYISYAIDVTTIQLNFVSFKWTYSFDGNDSPYEDSLMWYLEDLASSNYAGIKSAIELDIQANMDSSNVMPSIADLFQQVTAAVNAFIGSLGDAFTQVTSLFWVTEGNNQGPTFLGMLILIGVGVGLVYFVYRVIKGLVHRI